MPNWCYTRMSVRGCEEDLEEFISAIRNGEDKCSFDLNKLFPCPKELQVTSGRFETNEDGSPSAKQLEMDAVYAKNTEKFDYPSWYEWCNDRWGSKWGACEVYADWRSVNELLVEFRSAWSPCTGLIRKISTMFPGLLFACTMTEESDAFFLWEVWAHGTGRHGEVGEGELIRFCDGVDEWDDGAYETCSAIRNRLEDELDAAMEVFVAEFTD